MQTFKCRFLGRERRYDKEEEIVLLLLLYLYLLFFFYNLIIERDAYYAKFIGITFLHIFQYDTGSIPWVPHSALDLPGTENAPPRRSIESRMCVRYHK